MPEQLNNLLNIIVFQSSCAHRCGTGCFNALAIAPLPLPAFTITHNGIDALTAITECNNRMHMVGHDDIADNIVLL